MPEAIFQSLDRLSTDILHHFTTHSRSRCISLHLCSHVLDCRKLMSPWTAFDILIHMISMNECDALGAEDASHPPGLP